MPIETTKDVAKVVTENVSAWSSIWQWTIGGIGTGLVGMWGHVTGRLKKLEETLVTAQQMKEHTEQEDKKFEDLFHEVREIGKAVARIEGKLEA